MYWSMMPHGMPTKLRSARWQSLASSNRSNSRPASSASAEETSSAAEELRPEPSGTVLRISRLGPPPRPPARTPSPGPPHRHAGEHQFPGHADGVVGPLVGGFRGAEGRRVELAQFPAVFRIDA